MSATRQAQPAAGKPVSDAPPIRPPGAVPENQFVDTCTACDKCVAACPEDIIVRGSGNFPEINFEQGECTFCAACIDSCPEAALLPMAEARLNIDLRVADSCLPHRQIVCRTCGDSCEAEAIRFRPRLGGAPVPEIDAAVCTGCGACVAACPERALEAKSMPRCEYHVASFIVGVRPEHAEELAGVVDAVQGLEVHSVAGAKLIVTAEAGSAGDLAQLTDQIRSHQHTVSLSPVYHEYTEDDTDDPTAGSPTNTSARGAPDS